MPSIDIIIPVLGSFFYLILLIFAFVKRKKYQESASPWLLIYLVLCFVWSVLQTLVQFSIFPAHLLELIIETGLLIFTIFLFVLTRFALRDSRPVYPVFLVGIVWLGLYLAVEIGNFILIPNLSLPILLIGWFMFMIGIAQVVYRARRISPIPFIKARTYYWSIGVIISALGGIMLAGFQIGGGSILYAIGTFVIATTLIRPYMPDIRQTEQEVLNYLVMTILTALVLILGAVVIATVITRTELPYSPTLVGAVIAFVMAALLTPLWLVSRRVAKKLIPQVQYDPDRILREYSQSISSVLDPDLLTTVAVGLISKTIEIQRGYLFLVEHELEDMLPRYRLRGSKGMGTGIQEVGLLANNSPFAHYFRQERLTLRQSDLDMQPRFQEISVEERNWIKSLDVELYIPIYTKEDWVGLIALGPKMNGLPYFENDLTLLSIIADQTAVALQNAKLVESLMRLNNDFRRAYASMEQANRHLQTVNVQLENLDRTKSEFISVASHELRTPLTVIRGYNEMMLEDPGVKGNPFQAKLVNGIHSGILRMQEIISSMLDIASIDSRSMELQHEEVSISNIIKLISKSLSTSIRERNLTFETENLSDLPAIDGDSEALRKVFYHIIVNAIKYTPDGGKITVTGVPVSAGQMGLLDGGIEVIISDTGIGISQENLDLIFKKFYQTGEVSLHSTGKTKFKGSGPGLGLAIAKGIVDAHRGQIWAESPGYDENCCPGSTFHVVLPLHYKNQP